MYFMHKTVTTRGPAHSNGIKHPHCTEHVDQVTAADGAADGRHRRVKANMSTVNFIQKPVHRQMIEYTRMNIGTTKIGSIWSNSTKHPHGPDHDHDECDREDKRMATKAAGGRLLGTCRPSTGWASHLQGTRRRRSARGGWAFQVSAHMRGGTSLGVCPAAVAGESVTSIGMPPPPAARVAARAAATAAASS
jgi:hypothetical protein